MSQMEVDAWGSHRAGRGEAFNKKRHACHFPQSASNLCIIRWLQSVCKELHSSAPSKSPLRIERKMSSSGGTETAPWSPVLWKAPEWFFVRVDGIAPTYQPDKYAAEENTIWKDVLGKIEKKLCFWDRCGLECEHCKEDTYRFTSCTDQSRDIQGAMVYDLYILLSYILAIYYSHRRLTWSWKFEELLQVRCKIRRAVNVLGNAPLTPTAHS
eukprot:XP_008757688.1 PREDICTED: uncharacterized protein LOC102552387 isoform X1 [Rattus norvegicus]